MYKIKHRWHFFLVGGTFLTAGPNVSVNLARYAKRKALRLRFTHPELSPPHAEVTTVEGDGWFIP